MHIRVSITKNIKTKTSVINVIGLFPYTFNSPFRYFGFVLVFRFRFGKSRYPYTKWKSETLSLESTTLRQLRYCSHDKHSTHLDFDQYADPRAGDFCV